MRWTTRLIDAATTAVARLLHFEYPADAVLSQFFRENTNLGSHERAMVAEAAYYVLRRKRSLEAALADDSGKRATARRLLLQGLLLQGLNLRELGPDVKEDEKTTLSANKAKFVQGRLKDPSGPAEMLDLPDWLYDKLAAALPAEELPLLADALNRPAPLDLRVNSLKGERDAVLARLNADGMVCTATPYSPLGIRLQAKPALSKHPLFIDGVIEVQDEGSQLLGLLLAPKRGEMVADFCAGAGGKTLLLGALMRSSGRLYAFDVAEKRLNNLKPRLARSGLSNVHPQRIEHERDAKIKRLAGKLDRVLVDAPCSGLGTLRRNPDLKWRQTPESVARIVEQQGSILAAAASLLKPGGRLVYATCSLLPEENDGVVDAFLAAHPDFAPVSAAEVLSRQGVGLDTGERLRLLPHRQGTDGFFAAVLERSKA